MAEDDSFDLFGQPYWVMGLYTLLDFEDNAQLPNQVMQMQDEAGAQPATVWLVPDSMMQEEAGQMENAEAEFNRNLNDEISGWVVETEDSSHDNGTSEVDKRSIYVGNVDYEATAKELLMLFKSCGHINRVTILRDEFGQSKGYAFIEFSNKKSVEFATTFEGIYFKQRRLKVKPKRTNRPGVTETDMERPRGRGRANGNRGRRDNWSRWGAKKRANQQN